MWDLVSIDCLLIPGAIGPPDKPRVRRLLERNVCDVFRSQDGRFGFSMPAKPTLETR